MQSPTEDLIIEIIKNRRLASADELGRLLFMTKPNIQYHLKIMLQKGLVEVFKRDNVLPQKPGRPELHYRLSRTSADNNITQLCDLLLDQGKRFTTGNLYHELARKLLPEMPRGAPMSNLLKHLVAEMNQRAYACRWEARKDGPVIMFGNCPYAEIIDRHAELCRMDAYLLETYLRCPVEQIAKLDPGFQAPSECQFWVKA